MTGPIAWLLDDSEFTPRAFCGTGWSDGLRWVHAGSDILIGLAYIAIPVALLFFVRRRGVPFSGLVWLFGAFILACGSTHLVEATMFQTPVYRLSGALKLVTAAVSWVTVLALVPAAPQIVRAVQTLSGRPPDGGWEGDPAAADRDRGRHFLAAVLAAVLVVLVRAALDPLLQNRQAFTLSLLAVVSVAWYGGLWPALVTLLLTLAAGVYLFTAPRHTFVVREFHDQFAVGLFLFSGVGCAVLGEAQRQSRRRVDRVHRAVLAKQGELEAEAGRRERAEADLTRHANDLRDARVRLDAALNAGGIATWVWDIPADQVHADARLAEFFGVSAADAAGGPLARYVAAIHPDDRPAVAATIGRAVETGGDFLADYRLVPADRPGPARWVSARGRVERDAAGCPLRMPGVVVDITDRKRTEERLNESEARFRTLTEAVPQVVWVARPDGHREYYNRRWYDFTGQTEAESLGFGWLDPVHPDDRARVEDRWGHSAATGEPYEVEYRLRAADGSYRWFLGRAMSQRDAAGAVARWFGTSTDIDEFKRLREGLRASEGRLRQLTETIPQLVWSCRPDGLCNYLSPQWLAYTGQPADAQLGLEWLDSVIHPADRERVAAAWQAAVGGGAGYDIEFRIRRHDGEYRWFQTRGTPVRDDGGAISQWFGTSTDVDDRKRAEAALRDSEARFRQLADAMPQIVFSARPDGHVDYFNRQWYEYTGLPADGGTGDASWAGVHEPGRLAEVAARWAHALTTGEPYQIEYRLRRADGAWRWHLGRALPARDESGAVVRWYGTNTDIDDQKRAEADLARSLERFRLLTEAIPQVVWNADAAGRITYFNTRWLEYTGVMVDGAADRGWLDAVHPAEAGRVYDAWQAAVVGAADRFAEELRLRRAADGAFRWFLAVAVPLRRADGRVDQWIGSMADIHAQKEQAATLEAMVADRTRMLTAEVAERRRAEERATAAAAELGRSNGELEKFAYVASHDLQEPLRKIQAFGDRLTSRHAAALGDQGKDYLGRMQASAARMQQLINDLLSFSRVTTKTQPFTRVDLNKTAADAVDDLHARLQQTGGAVDVGPLPAVDADPTQVRQLLQNLIGNALKFHKPGQPPRVTVRGELADAPGPDGGPPRAVCRLTVADDGIGFDEKYLDRIFQVFQRLHGRTEYEGTGVGLAICRKIAERHGGDVTARSVPGQGATFVVTLPVRQAARGES